MTPATFKAFRDIAYEQAGIHLRDGKEALVSARLANRVRDLGLSGEAEYLERLRGDRSGGEMIRFVDAIATKPTSFFRDRTHFDLLEAEARRRAAQGAQKFRVWCAASSSGEEPYGVAITLLEAFGSSGVDHRVLATDISTRVLEKAIEGRYTERQIEPIERSLVARYFTRIAERESAGAIYEVGSALRERVAFKRLNLAAPPFRMKGPFDVVMCRNVMIDFDHHVRQRLVAEAAQMLVPGGLLFIGRSETLSGIPTSLVHVHPSVYRKVTS